MLSLMVKISFDDEINLIPQPKVLKTQKLELEFKVGVYIEILVNSGQLGSYLYHSCIFRLSKS